jgi:hypothetical protein
MQIVFRIFDRDESRAQQIESMLYAGMKASQIEGKVCQVCCLQEFGRQGVKQLPALELNDIILSQGKPLTEAMLSDTCARLAYAIKKMSKTEKK